MENEAEIVKRAQAGDSQAFGELYDHYLGQIYRFVYYKVFSKETAEDLVSDTFMKAFGRLSSYKENRGQFSTWLYQIARNTVIDYYRTQKSHISIDDTFDIPFNERTPEQIDVLASLNKVEEYLKKLPARQREIIMMRVWEGQSFKEIASNIGGSESSIKMAFSRSIRQLRDECGDSALLWYALAGTGASLPFANISYYINI